MSNFKLKFIYYLGQIPKLYLSIFIDVQLTFLAYFLSFLLRFDFRIPSDSLSMFYLTFPIVIIIKIITYIYFNLNRVVWHYTSISDLIKIIKSSTLSNILYGLIVYLLFHFQNYPRSVILLDWFLYIAFLSGTRLFYRFYFESHHKSKQKLKRTLIIGAGDAAESLIREMVTNKIHYIPVGILDDDSTKWNLYIHGVKIYGPIKNVYQISKKLNVNEIIIAIPSSTSDQMKKIVKYCEKCKNLDIAYKTLPGLNEILNMKKSATAIRDIKLEDLINRELVTIDQMEIRKEFSDKIILITGAAGSIGSELARQIFSCKPKDLILIDRNENNMLYLEKELEQFVSNSQYKTIIADITDNYKMELIIKEYQPDYIFHAAAFKHVPYMELSADEAVNNNVWGTFNLAKLAQKYRVYKFIQISTDKAVQPTNIMGCTKRLAELCLINLFKESRTQFIIVRFGNVIGSEGSVVEIFKRQIKAGGPVTVTHPKMRRYFMTIPEAVRLTLQAGYIGEHGNILVLDMGKQIPILEIAENLIRLSGFKPYEDIRIEFCGIRPGEKLAEALWEENEVPIPTNHPKIFKTLCNDVKYKFDSKAFWHLIKLTKIHSQNGEIKLILKKLVPTYHPYEKKQIYDQVNVMK